MFRLSAKSGDRVSVAPFWVVACCLALASCEGGELPAGPVKDQETGRLSVSIKLGKIAAASISRAELLVTGSGLVEVRQDLTVSGDTVTGTITDIPAGPDRMFTLNGYDASGILTYTGSATATVIAGQQVTVRIVLRPTGVTGSEKEITVALPGGVTMDFVWIEPGTFAMGAPESQRVEENEGPQHQVTITRGFYLGKYEITQEQYEKVTGQAHWVDKSAVQSKPNNPASYISWIMVREFISVLNAAAGDSLYRLPTEAEWEYACRAGTTTKWSFGDDKAQLGEYAWYHANAFDLDAGYPHAVGLKKPNPWGLHDMYGNVWEYCQDRYDLFSSASQVDPTGPLVAAKRTGDEARVIRGGSYADEGRSAVRLPGKQGEKGGGGRSNVGARLVRIGKSP